MTCLTAAWEDIAGGEIGLNTCVESTVGLRIGEAETSLTFVEVGKVLPMAGLTVGGDTAILTVGSFCCMGLDGLIFGIISGIGLTGWVVWLPGLSVVTSASFVPVNADTGTRLTDLTGT